ncbi:uncharacterized protein LOC108666882 [Hyalella azteca]|uniref:Uncharacterized protein LOC108666882 n=1 Tax=Hyalella azteca TaxID=294128 RepID=A0A8B7N602_HYAAZ|nr:uncharacterized protein LOC108666882 [Hyalella azteca]
MLFLPVLVVVLALTNTGLGEELPMSESEQKSEAAVGEAGEYQATEADEGSGTEPPQDLPIAEALVGEEGEIYDISPAEELRIAAQKAGYNITGMTLDLATHATEEELAEALPQPLAEALIQRRRRPDLRDRLIGMTFLGQPVPLDRVPRRPFLSEHQSQRRRSGAGPIRRFPATFAQKRNDYVTSEVEGRPRILKPVPFPASRARIIFPPMPGRPDEHAGDSNAGHRQQESRPMGFQIHGAGNAPKQKFVPRPQTIFDRGQNPHFDPSHRPRKKPFEVFDLRDTAIVNPMLRPQRPLQDLPTIEDEFDNSLGPDFGPVIYEIDHNIQTIIPNSFSSLDSEQTSTNNVSPFAPFPSSSSGSKLPPPPFRPKQFPPSTPLSTGFTNFGNSEKPKPEGNFKPDRKSECTQYTETICLDADNYPHTEILAALEGDKGRTNVLIAEVRNQSADNLVDGVTARQEQTYDYTHYFGDGNRRQGAEEHRDFGGEGGYLCPSEVKYAKPKRARNSKGEWKFVVNMEKYTQTIRMEKCIKPGGACSYVSHHYRATCNQVHNYQRLLSWEKKRGLHMDIFKVPSSCTCHIQGYSYVFPPLGQDKPGQGPPPDSLLLETRASNDLNIPTRVVTTPAHPRDVRLPNTNVNAHTPPSENPSPSTPPNGGPFTRLPAHQRPTASQRPTAGQRPPPFERPTPFRKNRTRRPPAPVPSGVRRMDVAGSFDSRQETFPPTDFGPNMGGGGLDMAHEESRMLQEHPGPGETPAGDLQQSYRNRAGPDLQSSRARGAPRQQSSGTGGGGVMNSDTMGGNHHGAVNYDYHPILQFFESYQS